jgi:hypothetical protein
VCVRKGVGRVGPASYSTTRSPAQPPRGKCPPPPRELHHIEASDSWWTRWTVGEGRWQKLLNWVSVCGGPATLYKKKGKARTLAAIRLLGPLRLGALLRGRRRCGLHEVLGVKGWTCFKVVVQGGQPAGGAGWAHKGGLHAKGRHSHHFLLLYCAPAQLFRFSKKKIVGEGMDHGSHVRVRVWVCSRHRGAGGNTVRGTGCGRGLAALQSVPITDAAQLVHNPQAGGA